MSGKRMIVVGFIVLGVGVLLSNLNVFVLQSGGLDYPGFFALMLGLALVGFGSHRRAVARRAQGDERRPRRAH